MSAQRSLLIATELDELHKVNAAIEELAEEENWSPDVTFQIGLAVEELGVNIVNYGGTTTTTSPRNQDRHLLRERGDYNRDRGRRPRLQSARRRSRAKLGRRC